MKKHTPGPWIAWDTGNGMGICPKECENALIPNVAAFQTEVTRILAPKPWTDEAWERRKADADLIAEAPEMLACLEYVFFECGIQGLSPEMNDRILNTIKRAGGGPE